MLNDKLLNDKAFSFGKNNIINPDSKTNEYQNESADKFIKKSKDNNIEKRGRIVNAKKENYHSGGVLLTFGMDKDNSKK